MCDSRCECFPYRLPEGELDLVLNCQISKLWNGVEGTLWKPDSLESNQ